jgi:hypothetical protein
LGLCDGLPYNFKEEWESSSNDDSNMEGSTTQQTTLAIVHHPDGEEGNPTSQTLHTLHNITNDHPGINNQNIPTDCATTSSTPHSPGTPITALKSSSTPETDTRRTRPRSPRASIRAIPDQHEFPYCASENIRCSVIHPLPSADQHDSTRGQRHIADPLLQHTKPIDDDDSATRVKRQKRTPSSRTSGDRSVLPIPTPPTDLPPSPSSIQGDPPGDDVTPNYSSFTFIIHKQNIPQHTPPTKKGPTFCSFDHGDHIHYLFSIRHPNNSSRTLTNILDFLKIGLAGIALTSFTIRFPVTSLPIKPCPLHPIS